MQEGSAQNHYSHAWWEEGSVIEPCCRARTRSLLRKGCSLACTFLEVPVFLRRVSLALSLLGMLTP